MRTKSFDEALVNYKKWQEKGLSLNMARGKPASEQLDLAAGLFTAVTQENFTSREGIDTRNYGELHGLIETRELMADIMGFPVENVVIAGCSSLTAMYDTHARLLLTPPPGGDKAWFLDEKRACLCPSPGYDRHFQMTAGLGYELISVDMKEDGPDMDEVERLVKENPHIRCIWCVPKYSNPTGAVYSEEVCRRLAKMETAAPDFRIFWDNAYAVHHLDPQNEKAEIPDMLALCEEAGNPDRLLAFSSTSKISFAGGGITAFAASKANLAWYEEQQKLQMICTDKVNQLRHARYYKDKKTLEAHMEKEAEILKPKFDAFIAAMEAHFSEDEDIQWTRPQGGYFIGVTLPEGTAARTVRLAKEAGLTLTGAGAPFPYGKDPQDSFLRIAPSYPSLEEMKEAAELFCACAELAVWEKKTK